MNHEYYRDRVSAYYDRSLSPDELRMMQEHLDQCEECRQLLQSLEKLDLLIEKNSELNESDYWEKSARNIEATIELQKSEKPVSSWRGLGWKVIATAASIAVLTFIGLNSDKIMKGFDRPPVLNMESSTPQPQKPDRTKQAASDEFMDEVSEITVTTGKSAKSTPPAQPEPTPQPEPASETEAKPETPLDFATNTDEEIPSKPVTSVDELLTQTAGIVENTSGEIFIRGGRAGEVSYIADGVPIDQPIIDQSEEDDLEVNSNDIAFGASEKKVSPPDLKINVSNQKDQIRKLSASNSVVKSSPQTDLAGWQKVRDSLLELTTKRDKIYSAEFSQVVSHDSVSEKNNKNDSTLTSRLAMLLKAQIRIVELSESENERQSALEFIKNHADDQTSPIHKTAASALKKIE